MALTRISALVFRERKKAKEGRVATRNRAVAFWAAIKGVIERAGAERGYWQEEGH